ncbi:MAG: type II toxin-antitoxin system RelB/DinJ family antitoxin [Treponema sp.]|nr:type II toxin-antitoxin system RelB/DinJ family antitoxin [Treponema sp.]
MEQTGLIQVRIEEQLKTDAESLFTDLGLDTSSAIRLFLKQAVAQNGIPFAITRQFSSADLREAKMIRLHEELLAVEAERHAGLKGYTPDELENYLDTVIDEAAHGAAV